MARVAVVGLGKVGLPLASFLHSYHTVVGFDKSVEIMRVLHSHKNPYPWEPIDNIEAIRWTDTLKDAIKDVSFIFIVVPTPQKGSYLSSSFVTEALDAIEKDLPKGHSPIISIVSTLDPRDTKEVCSRPGLRIVYNPPLIKLGTVKNDFTNTRICFLGGDKELIDQVEKIYYPSGTPKGVSVIRGDHVTIATAKLAVNANRSMRVAWANDTAAKCATLGADYKVVLDAVGPDPRSGPTFMRKGPPPGGPCIPRDMDVWADIRGMSNLPAEVLRTHKLTAINILERVDNWVYKLSIPMLNILILGATYNPQGLDVTNSIGIAILKHAKKVGWAAKIHDPARESIKHMCLDVYLEKDNDFSTALDWADAIIVATLWDEYRNIKTTKPKLVLDWRD